jgi:glycosyltransferase involved in cell wall biosynthesis
MIFIFDSHPVQYKAPVYQRLQQLRPGSFRVIYASDASVRGHRDAEFETEVTWDTPLMEGYDHVVLGNERGTPFQGFRSLTGRGVFEMLQREKPKAALLSQFLYAFDFATYAACLRLRIPIWIRQETQDEAFLRPAWKQIVRGLAYRLAYAGVEHAFYVGALNREHLLRHGLPESRLTRAPYCTPPPPDLVTQQKSRDRLRAQLGIRPGETLLLFSGKLIEKKNPQLLLEAFRLLTDEERARCQVLFVGAGPLAADLRLLAAEFQDRVHFAGFVNQSEIFSYYAAADILILPSKRAGETWGLVVNEALHAGCGVIVTRAVGCHREFGEWERVRVIEIGDARGCAESIRQLARYPHSLTWCAEAMKAYGVEAAAQALARQFDTVGEPPPVS